MKNHKNISPEDEWYNSYWNANASDADWASADGDEEKKERVSAPYIIRVVSTNDGGGTANVDIGDSYTNRAASNFNQSAQITISSTITGVTYIEFLAQSESQPFYIGRTMVISTSAGQIEQTVAVTHRDANGDRVDHILAPTVDPYQNQTDRIIDDYTYLFDGATRLRINRVNALATVTFRLYPTGKFVATQLVAGRNALPKYMAPHIIKVAPTAVARPKTN